MAIIAMILTASVSSSHSFEAWYVLNYELEVMIAIDFLSLALYATELTTL